jgi:retron-type reverse transcriptase
MKIQKEKMNLNIMRKNLKENYEQTTFKVLKTINAIAVKSSKDPNAKFDNLMRLIANEGILYQAIGNISGKSGALTKGPKQDERTVDATSIEFVEELSQKLKTGTFRFNPIRRVYMDKSGKQPASKEQLKQLKEMHSNGFVTMQQIKETKTRPLGISSFPDKVVQEAMRIILNAIYEPEFARQNVNRGFRPKYGCADAIASIQRYAKSMCFAVEGDIKGAFDNVNHDILMKILRKRILDEKFLKLIHGGLKCGIIYLNFSQETNLGSVQGSVVSPLLYNVYFNEFDVFMNTDFKGIVDLINNKEGRTPRPVNKLYNSYSKKKSLMNLNKHKEKVKEYANKPNCEKTKLIEMQLKLKEIIEKYKYLDKEQKKLPTFALSRQTIRYFYQRYADDWVFFTNADKERVLEWKELFTKWIKDNLELQLSPEKTKVTDLRKRELVKFLGFQLMREGKRTNIIKVGRFKKKRTDIARRSKMVMIKVDKPNKVYTTRGANPTLIVTWDRERVINRMIDNGFVKKVGCSYRGKSKLPWTVLSEPEIIQRFKYIIRGYIDYYTPVSDYPTGIQFLYYLLKYSCAHTLAQKRQTTLKKIFRKFGKDLKIQYTEKSTVRKKDGQVTEREVNKTESMFTWYECLQIIRTTLLTTRKKQKNKKTDSISIINKAVDDICNVKVNWRTAYKLSKYCSICGSTDKIEYHHERHIKDRNTKVTGFLQIMNQLNRKQMPTCRHCHRKIHRGEYNDLPISQLYDEELIIL